MKQVLLARAFGDFMVALSTASASKNITDFKLVASEHHRPLYEAIPAQYKNPALTIEFTNWGINSSMLGVFTNKRLLLPNSIKELRNFKNWLSQQAPNNEYIVEQDLRKNIIQVVTAKKFKHIASGENIYQQYQSFFQSPPVEINYDPKKINRVLILPSARLSFRDIPPSLVNEIRVKHEQNKQEVQIAYYKNPPLNLLESPKLELYQNFAKLIELIVNADFIYTPDSLPAHLAYFFGKPHAILHPAKISPAFFTPFALANKTHYSFAEFPRS